MADNNRIQNSELGEIGFSENNHIATQPQVPLPKVYVEPCQTDFFYEKFKHSYPMFKNPRGLCLIINIYQIDGMPPRRWSNRDTESLKQLFEQLLFNVKAYTDSTHDLSCQNFKSIVKNFTEMPEHTDAQCCVICLMSHGEEGYLTTKEGDKILLDDIFSMFNNVNCPNLAGKPKLFFIQSCRDDPISGPAEDLGIRLSFNGKSESGPNSSKDEADSNNPENLPHSKKKSTTDQKNENSENLESKTIFHIPTLCDILVGYPTQKGYIAYRKPEVGSWYMNAIVQVFSKHACDTDICALLNMVNNLISNEVTNTGKKQMSEYTSKLTKPYFYFFPGLATETVSEPESTKENSKNVSQNESDNNLYYQTSNKKQRLDILTDNDTNTLIENLLGNNMNSKSSSNFIAKYGSCVLSSDGDQSDSTLKNEMSNTKFLIRAEHIEFVAKKANSYWKPIAREIRLLNECQILEIERSPKFLSMSEKLAFVLEIWLKNDKSGKFSCKLENLVKILTACRLNKVKEELLTQCF